MWRWPPGCNAIQYNNTLLVLKKEIRCRVSSVLKNDEQDGDVTNMGFRELSRMAAFFMTSIIDTAQPSRRCHRRYDNCHVCWNCWSVKIVKTTWLPLCGIRLQSWRFLLWKAYRDDAGPSLKKIKKISNKNDASVLKQDPTHIKCSKNAIY